MKNSLTKTFKLAAASALTVFAFTGCMTSGSAGVDITTDGGNGAIVQETSNMGVVLNESSSMPKIASGDSDTITKEKIVVLRHYDAVCQCFIRSTQFDNKKGFARQRLDSIWLDSSGHLLAVYFPGHADSITHVRHVTRINGNSGNNVDVTLRTTLVRKLENGVNVYHWNGTITGTFNGTEFTSSSFAITRTYAAGVGFGYASGTIDLHRGDYEMIFIFDGSSNSASCTINHKGVLLRVVHIDSDDNET